MEEILSLVFFSSNSIVKLLGGIILMAIVLYQPQKWIMSYGQKQKQGFVKMKKNYK